jgi:hypothetical protein
MVQSNNSRLYTDEELKLVHSQSLGNESLAAEANDCACYSCLEHFAAVQITSWTDSPPNRTAMCPMCDMDSVIIETVATRVDDQLLKEMRIRYFGDDGA